MFKKKKLVQPTKFTIKAISVGNRIELTAYSGYLIGKEVGVVVLIRNGRENRYRVDTFLVRARVRRHGIGRKLMETAINEAKKMGATSVFVYPSPFGYEGDPELKITELWEIYQHLGFEFWDGNGMERDIYSVLSNKMVKKI